MAVEERQVVVMVEEKMYEIKESGVFAARYESMRLTAYGRTTSEASVNLRRLFNQEIKYFRQKGHLEGRLRRLGVEWFWKDQYPADRPAYEDTSLPENSSTEVRQRAVRSSGSVASIAGWYDLSEALGLAA